MIELELCRALRDRAAAIVSDLLLPTNSGNLRAPHIINGWIPPKKNQTPPRGPKNNSEAEDDTDAAKFPFIVVRPLLGDTSAENHTTAKIKLLIGCFGEDDAGHENVLLVIARLRTWLLAQPVLENRFGAELPISWELYEDQPAPYWMGELVTEWTLPTPLDVSAEDDC